ncbi:MAG TPA: M48 family metallopeptidase [Pyrinomonadaceae bacterium]|nr:M48 family metallopeptidase [Pyrinomonadaceae bacterium]
MSENTLAFNDNPTASINLNFNRYMEQRTSEMSRHLINGIPDYAFTMDLELRRKLAAIPGVRVLAGAIASARLSFEKQLMLQKGVAVTPKQYPEIYEMVQDCARILGIGVPEVYVIMNPVPNAYTLASNQSADMVVVHSSLVEMTTPEELKFILGHECGHIHNLHSVFNTAAILLTDTTLKGLVSAIPGLQLAIFLAAKGLGMFFSHWSRAAEITCDRAGVICTGSISAGQTALAKLSTGGVSAYGKIDIQEFIKQLERTQATPLRLMELTATHPLIPKRLKALEIFADCDVLHDWRPEMRTTNPPRPHSEVDAEIKQQIRVL